MGSIQQILLDLAPVFGSGFRLSRSSANPPPNDHGAKSLCCEQIDEWATELSAGLLLDSDSLAPRAHANLSDAIVYRLGQKYCGRKRLELIPCSACDVRPDTHGLHTCRWGTKLVALNNPPGSRLAFISSAVLRASSHGAPSQ